MRVKFTPAVWLSGNSVTSLDQRGCYTPGQVSTVMGDRLRTSKPSAPPICWPILLPSVGQ